MPYTKNEPNVLPKVYKALLTQTGTDAPVATVLENTLGTVTYSYTSAGKWIAQSSGLFTLNKTYVILNPTVNIPRFFYRTDSLDASNIPLEQYEIGAGYFDGLNKREITILVYP
jgi:hypothetical protein